MGALMAPINVPNDRWIIHLASGRRGKSLGTTITAWLMVVACSILALSLVWDADGNPNTDNLQPAVACVEVRIAAEVDAHVEDGEGARPRERYRGLRWLRWRPVVVREWRWRPLGLPLRGP